MPNLHPFIVHFPIALLSAALLFDLFSVSSGKNGFERVGWWNMLFGVIGLLAALVSGLQAEQALVTDSMTRQALDRHQQTAFVVSAIFFSLLLWRAGTKSVLPSRLRPLFLLLYILGTTLLWLGAWYGGNLVYEHAVGVGGG
jgi:uncharacterized membrane protein